MGEVQARGPNVFAGYRGAPEATVAAFAAFCRARAEETTGA